MVIESTSIRTIIDLLESLRKNSFTASEIRISYTQRGGKKQYVTFSSLDELILNYNNLYSKKFRKRKAHIQVTLPFLYSRNLLRQ